LCYSLIQYVTFGVQGTEDHTVAKRPGDPVKLSAEDNTRMVRLFEEVVGKYAEMSSIIARARGDSALPFRTLEPERAIVLKIHGPSGGSGQNSRFKYCLDVGDGEVWEDPPGVCRGGAC
jgi:hypothetical protein